MKCLHILNPVLIAGAMFLFITAGAVETAAVRTPTGNYAVEYRIMPEVSGGRMPKSWSFVISHPVDNIYQQVSVSGRFRGRTVPLRAGCGKLILFNGGKVRVKSPFRYCFNVTLYQLRTNWKNIHPVLPPSGKYPEFTGRNLPWIDPEHPEIKRISGKIRRKSSKTLNYIRNCYKFVTEHFKYLNPNTGFHSLDKIISDGGGDCGNLSSVFISLLRCAGIPARHVVGRRIDGSYHVWSEFYLEKYGWFPADVTADLGRKQFKCFGNWNDPCVVMHRGLGFELPGMKSFGRIAAVQNYFYCYSGLPRMTIKDSFSGKRL